MVFELNERSNCNNGEKLTIGRKAVHSDNQCTRTQESANLRRYAVKGGGVSKINKPFIYIAY